MSIFQDCNYNVSNPKGVLIMVLFRIANIGNKNIYFFLLFLPYLIFYRFFVEWILGVEIPYKTKIGKNFVLFHGQALVINDGTIIGDNCIIRHCTTIGNKRLKDGSYSGCPVIGNNVDIGSNVCIFGPIVIGDNVTIGAGSVVIRDVPSNSVVVGNPARLIS